VTWESEASDSCPGPVTVECEPSSGSTFPCGTTTVTCTATDYSDNVSQCTFPVIVGIPVSVDVRPGTCPNPFKTTEQGLVPVVIHGTRTFDVTTIDPASVTLEGIPAVRWTLEDAGAPYEPYTGKDDCLDCSTAKKDRIRDLALKFDAVALADAMGEVTHGECRAVQLTGLLSTGCPVVGEDILKILALPEVGVEPAAQTPEVAPAELSARNPNPFRSGDRIEYALPLSGRARLVIYDVLGRMVRVLADGEQAAGQHHLAWDGRDEAGARVTNGLYFYILTVSPEDGSGVRMEKQRIVLTR
jgi:hypothetical protein